MLLLIPLRRRERLACPECGDGCDLRLALLGVLDPLTRQHALGVFILALNEPGDGEVAGRALESEERMLVRVLTRTDNRFVAGPYSSPSMSPNHNLMVTAHAEIRGDDLDGEEVFSGETPKGHSMCTTCGAGLVRSDSELCG